MMAETKQEEWDYEAYLTDSGQWYGARCPAIVFDVHSQEHYEIEWSNCNTASKYVYDMRKCGEVLKSLYHLTGFCMSV